MPDPFFEPYHTSFAFLQDVKWYRQGLQSTFPSWQCQIPCRYRRPLTPWETFFRNVLLLNLCSISVPLRFYLCCIFDCISLSLLTTVKLNKHSTPKKNSSTRSQLVLWPKSPFSFLPQSMSNIHYSFSQYRICLPFISMSRTLCQSSLASFIRTRCGDWRHSDAGNRGQPRHDHG
jgi:hypothetical protein